MFVILGVDHKANESKTVSSLIRQAGDAYGFSFKLYLYIFLK